MTRTMPWGHTDSAPPIVATLLNIAAALLRKASEMLEVRAARVAQAAQAEATAAAEELLAAGTQTMEFHCFHRDAGAPEGALYVNGELVGFVAGVNRL